MNNIVIDICSKSADDIWADNMMETVTEPESLVRILMTGTFLNAAQKQLINKEVQALYDNTDDCDSIKLSVRATVFNIHGVDVNDGAEPSEQTASFWNEIIEGVLAEAQRYLRDADIPF